MPKLHFLSACTGFVIAGLLALTTSQASPPPASLNPASLRVEYMPHPRDMVQIQQGTPYTVPAGKLFVLTALGVINGGGANATLLVDGTGECFAPGAPSELDPAAVAPGLAIPAGRVIEVTVAGATTGRAWGYLASQ